MEETVFRLFRAENELAENALKANNLLSQPCHSIRTDAAGKVTDVTLGFLHFTGYSLEDFFGKKCNLLQGEQTDKEDVIAISKAIHNKLPISVVLLNYCKNGEPFWNVLKIVPELEGNDLKGFYSQIVGIPIPGSMLLKPKLQLEDAEALIGVLSSIPKEIKMISEDKDSVSTATLSEDLKPSSSCNLVFVAETKLPTDKGIFRVRAYRDLDTGAEPLAIISGAVEFQSGVLCRVHDQCATSEVFGSLKCDCKQQLDYALEQIKLNQPGLVFYLPQEGRGIGIANKVAAYALQESGLDTVDANRALGLPDDAREYSCVKEMLEDLNIKSVNLMTNNPRKISELESLGVKVLSRVECVCKPTSEHGLNYIKAKTRRMGHLFQQSQLS